MIMTNKKSKILCLWDLAGTLFPEKWNINTGFDSYVKWLENKLGRKRKEISDREYEENFKIPYLNGEMFNLQIQPDFKKVLSWTKRNETFSTGNREQMAWRARYLNHKIGFNILDYFQVMNSTFDYGQTNKKTPEMMIDYLEKKYDADYQTVVYTDDNLKNLKFFIQAGQVIKKKHPDFNWRLYHILNTASLIKNKDDYFEIGKLSDFLANEKKLRKQYATINHNLKKNKTN